MSERRRGRRMNCFPFIERDPGTTSTSSNSTGGFAFGDGTVYYANRLYILNVHIKYTYIHISLMLDNLLIDIIY